MSLFRHIVTICALSGITCSLMAALHATIPQMWVFSTCVNVFYTLHRKDDPEAQP